MHTSLHSSGLIPSEFLHPFLVRQLPFQTLVGFGNGLKIQSHRRNVWGATSDESWNAMRVENTNKKGETAPFCVLEPALSKTACCFKITKTRDLAVLANKMHQLQ